MDKYLPYFVVPPIDLGIVKLQPFGILVAIGVVLGAHVARRHAERSGADIDTIQGLIGWMVIAGFIGAHVFDVLAYTPGRLLEDPLLLFKVWAGISSVGGMIGSYIGFTVFFRKPENRSRSKLRYMDSAVFAGVVGYLVGRLGCTLVHDHPGRHTEFFLAFAFPDGPRHDLGFYEFLGLVAILAIMTLAARRDRPSGWFAGLVAVLYGPMRFCLDFLRVQDSEHADPRYFGLTPAHYVSAGIVLLGAVVLWYAYARGTSVTPTCFGPEARARQDASRKADAEAAAQREAGHARSGGSSKKRRS